jgi:hypothetical protein
LKVLFFKDFVNIIRVLKLEGFLNWSVQQTEKKKNVTRFCADLTTTVKGISGYKRVIDEI